MKASHGLLAGLLLLIYGVIGGQPNLRGGTATITYLWLYTAAFGGYLLALLYFHRHPPDLRLLVVVGALCRVLLWSQPPTLSDDVYRYIWDGHIAAQGINPYAHPVDSPTLDQFAIPERALVNNAWMASPYLPTAQIVFWLLHWIPLPLTLAFQIAATLLDLLSAGLIVLLLRHLKRPLWRVAIYLWHPLVIVEFAHGAHIVDALMIALTLAALLALLKGRPAASGALLALATLTKGLPVLLLAGVGRRWHWPAWVSYGVVGWAITLPYLWGVGFGLAGPRTGTGMFGALRIYSYQWNFNGGVYHWLEGLLTGIWSPGALLPDTPGVAAAKQIAGLLLLLGVLAVGWGCWRQTLSDDALLAWAFVPFALYYLLATTVHPWYLALLVPGMVFAGLRQWGALLAGLLYWSWSVSLSYFTYLDPVNLRETDLVRLAEYLPAYSLFLTVALLSRRWRRKSRASTMLKPPT